MPGLLKTTLAPREGSFVEPSPAVRDKVGVTAAEYFSTARDFGDAQIT